jgi:hypothetical protein
VRADAIRVLKHFREFVNEKRRETQLLVRGDKQFASHPLVNLDLISGA